jgi:hypothetical protein
MPVPDQVRDDGSGIQLKKVVNSSGFRIKSGMTYRDWALFELYQTLLWTNNEV